MQWLESGNWEPEIVLEAETLDDNRNEGGAGQACENGDR